MKSFALAAAALMATPAFAGVTTLDFEGVTGFASIGTTYAAPGGISFGPDAQGLVNDALGPYFSNAPTPVGVMFVSGITVPDAAMNVAPGFNELSFYYSSADAVTKAVQVWSGGNGTGTLIASYDLLANAAQGCADTPYCHWDRLGGKLSQTALSVTFGAGTQAAAFDNISVVPAPPSVLLAGLALAVLAISSSNSRRRSWQGAAGLPPAAPKMGVHG